MPTSLLLTGASGFLGRTIRQQLSAKYAITTLGKKEENDIVCDLATAIPAFNQPADVVVHAAGKAHSIPKTEAEKQDFFQVNFIGTQNLCKGLEALTTKPKALIFVSTVAVYGRDEGELINEQHPLQGNTPYAKSKIAAEHFLRQWCAAHQVRLAVLRLPLIVGNNPPGNLGVMIKGIRQGRYFSIGGGHARKSMVLASDVAAVIPTLAETEGTFNLTDGYHPSFKELSASIAQQLGRPVPKNIPHGVAKLLASAGDLLGPSAPINTHKLKKITATLTFDDSLAHQLFGWHPQPVVEAFAIE